MVFYNKIWWTALRCLAGDLLSAIQGAQNMADLAHVRCFTDEFKQDVQCLASTCSFYKNKARYHLLRKKSVEAILTVDR